MDDRGAGADVRRKRHIDALVAEEPLDVLREDLPRPHLQLRMLGRQRSTSAGRVS